MSFDNLNPEELEIARQQVVQYGQRANEIARELVVSCIGNDHHAGGLLVREMYDTPDLLMLVVGLLVSAVAKGIGPVATPEQLGIDTTEAPELWQVAEADQMEAAASENDIEGFAKIALDAQVRALTQDFRGHFAEHGHYPDMGNVMRGLLILDRGTLTVIAAEAIQRLTMQEVHKEG